MHVLPVSTSYALTVSRIYLSTFNEGGGVGGRWGAASLSQQTGFSIMGALSSHQHFSPPHKSLSFSFCYLK